MSLENQSMFSKTVNLSKHVPASDLKCRITFVSGTLRKTMYAMKQLREIPPFKGVRTVYLAFVESRIIHCIIGFRCRVDENALVQLKPGQNTIAGVAGEKHSKYMIKKPFG